MIDGSRTSAGQPDSYESATQQAVAALTPAAWAQLRSFVDQVNARWPAGKSDYRAPWDREGEEFDPLAGAVVAFVRDNGLVVPGFDWAAWDGGGDLLNLHGIRNLAPVLGPGEVLGLMTGVVGVEGSSVWALTDAFENGFLPALIARLLDFRPDAGER